MNLKKFSTAGALITLLVLSGCKSKLEKMGDEFLEQGKIRNAVTFYTKANAKGEVSEEFNDNFILAYTRMMDQVAKKDPASGAIRGYVEEIQKRIGECKRPEVTTEFVETLSKVARAQVEIGGDDYGIILQAFAFFDIAKNVSKSQGNAGKAELDKNFSSVENKYLDMVISEAEGMESSVATEYKYLEAQNVIPDNQKLKEKLNEIRKKNRGDFLIFQAAGIEHPSPKVDIYSYVFAFPSVSITGTNTTGELQVWNSAGNNVEITAEEIFLVSTDGKKVAGKQIGNGTCTSPELDKEFKNKTVNFTGKALLIVEGNCSMKVSWTYDSGFTPDYVSWENEFGKGRKYLGI
jgi:hypothetical protein